ncbi:hypothetical protein MRX96_055343 [Rhipicephalus microplus]
MKDGRKSGSPPPRGYSRPRQTTRPAWAILVAKQDQELMECAGNVTLVRERGRTKGESDEVEAHEDEVAVTHRQPPLAGGSSNNARAPANSNARHDKNRLHQ